LKDKEKRTRSVAAGIAWVAGTLFFALLPVDLPAVDNRLILVDSLFESRKPKKATKADPLRAAIQIPRDIDQSQELSYFCGLVANRTNPDGGEVESVARVRAEWETRVFLLDRASAQFETLDVASGVFKTKESGANFERIELPPAVTAAIFSAGFESGEVSARIVTTAQVIKGRKITLVVFQCSLDELTS